MFGATVGVEVATDNGPFIVSALPRSLTNENITQFLHLTHKVRQYFNLICPPHIQFANTHGGQRI